MQFDLFMKHIRFMNTTTIILILPNILYRYIINLIVN